MRMKKLKKYVLYTKSPGLVNFKVQVRNSPKFKQLQINLLKFTEILGKLQDELEFE